MAFRKRLPSLAIPVTNLVYITRNEYLSNNLSLKLSEAYEKLRYQLRLLLLLPYTASVRSNEVDEVDVSPRVYSTIAQYTFLKILEEEAKKEGLSNERVAVIFNTVSKVTQIPENVYKSISYLNSAVFFSFPYESEKPITVKAKTRRAAFEELIKSIEEALSRGDSIPLDIRPIEIYVKKAAELGKRSETEVRIFLKSVHEVFETPSLPLFVMIPMIVGNLKEHKTFAQAQSVAMNAMRSIRNFDDRIRKVIRKIEGRHISRESLYVILDTLLKVKKYADIVFELVPDEYRDVLEDKNGELHRALKKIDMSEGSVDRYRPLKERVKNVTKARDPEKKKDEIAKAALVVLRIFCEAINRVYRPKGRKAKLHKLVIIPVEDSLEHYQKFLATHTDIVDLVGDTTIFTDNRDETRVTAQGKQELIRLKFISDKIKRKKEEVLKKIEDDKKRDVLDGLLKLDMNVEIRDVLGIARFIIPQTLIGVYRGAQRATSPLYYMICSIDIPLSALATISVISGLIPTIKLKVVEEDGEKAYLLYVLDMFGYASGPCPHNPVRTIVNLRGTLYGAELRDPIKEVFGIEGDEVEKYKEACEDFLKNLLKLDKISSEGEDETIKTRNLFTTAVMALHSLIAMNAIANVSPKPSCPSSSLPKLHVSDVLREAKRMGINADDRRVCYNSRICPMSKINVSLYPIDSLYTLPNVLSLALSYVNSDKAKLLIDLRMNFFNNLLGLTEKDRKLMRIAKVFVHACATGTYVSHAFILGAVSGAKLNYKRGILARGRFDAKTIYMEPCLQGKVIVKKIAETYLKEKKGEGCASSLSKIINNSSRRPDVVLKSILDSESCREKIHSGIDVPLPRPIYKMHVLGSHTEFEGEFYRMKNVLIDRRLFLRRDKTADLSVIDELFNELEKLDEEDLKEFSFSSPGEKGGKKEVKEDLILRLIHTIAPKLASLYISYIPLYDDVPSNKRGVVTKLIENHAELVKDIFEEYAREGTRIIEKIKKLKKRKGAFDYKIKKIRVSGCSSDESYEYIIKPVPAFSEEASEEDLALSAYGPCIKPDCILQQCLPKLAIPPSTLRILVGIGKFLISGEADPKYFPILTTNRGLITVLKQLSLYFASINKEKIPLYVLAEFEDKGDSFTLKRILGLREDELSIKIERKSASHVIPYPINKLDEKLLRLREEELKRRLPNEKETKMSVIEFLEKLLSAFADASRKYYGISHGTSPKIEIYPIPILRKENPLSRAVHVLVRSSSMKERNGEKRKRIERGDKEVYVEYKMQVISKFGSIKRKRKVIPVPTKGFAASLPRQSSDYYNALATYFLSNRLSTIPGGYNKGLYIYEAPFVKPDLDLIDLLSKDDALYVVLARLRDLYLDIPTADNVEGSVLIGTFRPENTINSLIRLD